MADAANESIISFDPLIQCLKEMPLRWRATAIVSSIAITLELAYFVFFAIPWGKMGVAEWAYWLGAIGTVGTLIGTIAISSSANRQMRKIELTKARLVACKLYYKQVHNSENTRLSAEAINKALKSYIFELSDVPGMLGCATKVVERLNKIAPLKSSDLVALAPLHNDCAARFAIGMGLVESCQTLLQGLAAPILPNLIKEQLFLCENMLNAAAREFLAAEIALYEALNAAFSN